MKRVYLLLAIVGSIAPWLFFGAYFGSAGLDMGGFVAGMFANSAAGGAATDLIISSLVFWVIMVVRQRRGQGPSPWLFIALNLLIGLSCALPAYMYVITKPAEQPQMRYQAERG